MPNKWEHFTDRELYDIHGAFTTAENEGMGGAIEELMKEVEQQLEMRGIKWWAAFPKEKE